jgi:hypothetical protein
VTAFLPEVAEIAVQKLLKQQLDQVEVESISSTDIDEDGNLVFHPPCARTRYLRSIFQTTNDSQMLTYNCEHIIQIFCAVDSLRSPEEQREDTKGLMGRILTQMAGARLVCADGSKSEPVRLIDCTGIEEDIVGTVYIVSVAVPGIAQFAGINANPNT